MSPLMIINCSKSPPISIPITVSISIRSNHTICNTKSEKFVPINPLSDSLRNKWINQAQSFVRRPIPLSSLPYNDTNNNNHKLIELIEQQKNGKDLVNVLKTNQNKISHNGLYNKSMQKCAMFKDWSDVHSIMKLLLSNPCIKPDIISFNIFINNMALSDQTQICIQYFAIMVNEYGINPDIITFSSLIKALRKQNLCNEAIKYWQIMSEKYKLIPHKILFAEMIGLYSKAQKLDKSTEIFNEYLSKVEMNEIECDSVVFNVYLNGFSRCGDMKGMQTVLDLFGKYNLELSNDTMSEIMHGCVKAKEYKQCLKIMQTWIDKTAMIPNTAMILSKCMALAQMINYSRNWNEKCDLFLRLKRVIYSELEFYGLSITPMIATTLLDGAIYLYESTPIQIVSGGPNLWSGTIR
eukprot:247626_1